MFILPGSRAEERRTAYKARFMGLYAMLAVIALGALFAFVKLAANNPVHIYHTKVVQTDLSNSTNLSKALGPADEGSPVAGESINPNLQGAKCDIWSKGREDIVIDCHS